MLRSLLGLALLLLPLRAFAQLPRTVVADLHAEGDLRDEAVGTSIVVAEALSRAAGAFVTRADAVEIASRADLIDAFQGAKVPARAGVWLSPTEVRGVADGAHARTVLVGTMRRDAAQIYVVLHRVEDDGTVRKTAKLSHPLRNLATLPAAVAERAGKLLGLEVRDVPPVRRMTLAALGRAWIAAQKKDVETAVAELERAAHDPRGEALAKPLGAFLRSAGEGATLRMRALLVVDPKAALAEAEKFATDNPSLMGARLLHARALLAVGRRTEALEVLKARPGDPEASELHSLRGAAMLDPKHAKEAQVELRRAIELNGDNVEAWYLLGEHLQAAKRYAAARDPRAVPEFLKVGSDEAYRALDPSQLAPEDAAALAQAPAGSYGRALLAVTGGKLDEAARLLKGDDAQTARLAGLVQAELGHHDAAMAAFAKVAPLEAGREARAAGKKKEAQDFLLRALPANEAVAPRELGEVLLGAGDQASAVAQLRKAAAVMPDDAEAHAALARALGASGDSQGAGAETRLAMAIDPELPLTPIAEGGAPAAGKPAAPSAPAQAPANPAAEPGGLGSIEIGAIAGGAALVLVLVVVARRKRGPRRERQTFGAMSATDRVAQPGTPSSRVPTPSPATLARAQDVPTVRPPSSESMQTAHDPPSMPGLASLLIEVVDFASIEIPGTQLTMSEKRPIVGARVWVGGDETKAAQTEQQSGAAVLYVPPGEHTLHVRAGSKLLEQVLTVTAPQKIALTVDLADEVVVPRQQQKPNP